MVIRKEEVNSSVKYRRYFTKLGASEKTHACTCKAALYTYAVHQNNEDTRNNLIEGIFTSLYKERVQLPLAVQTQLIYKDEPLRVTFSCARP